MRILFVLLTTLACISCRQTGKDYSTASLNLKGGVEAIQQEERTFTHDTDRFKKREITFTNGRLAQIASWSLPLRTTPNEQYLLQYEDEKLTQVEFKVFSKEGEAHTYTFKPAEFRFSFDVPKPAINMDRDSVIRNEHGDVATVYCIDRDGLIMKTYTSEYTYDEKGNWIVRKLYDDGVLYREVKRNIVYTSYKEAGTSQGS